MGIKAFYTLNGVRLEENNAEAVIHLTSAEKQEKTVSISFRKYKAGLVKL